MDGLTFQIFCTSSTLVSGLAGLNVVLPFKFDRVHGRPDAGRAAVVRREGLAGPVAEELPAELIAAIARHHVDAHAALAHLGGVGAGDVADLLEARIVPVDATERALRAEVIEAQAFDGLHGVA